MKYSYNVIKIPKGKKGVKMKVMRTPLPVTNAKPRISVRVKDGTRFGNMLMEQFVNGDRFKLAEKLRQMGDIIASTERAESYMRYAHVIILTEEA